MKVITKIKVVIQKKGNQKKIEYKKYKKELKNKNGNTKTKKGRPKYNREYKYTKGNTKIQKRIQKQKGIQRENTKRKKGIRKKGIQKCITECKNKRNDIKK